MKRERALAGGLEAQVWVLALYLTCYVWLWASFLTSLGLPPHAPLWNGPDHWFSTGTEEPSGRGLAIRWLNRSQGWQPSCNIQDSPEQCNNVPTPTNIPPEFLVREKPRTYFWIKPFSYNPRVVFCSCLIYSECTSFYGVSSCPSTPSFPYTFCSEWLWLYLLNSNLLW